MIDLDDGQAATCPSCWGTSTMAVDMIVDMLTCPRCGSTFAQGTGLWDRYNSRVVRQVGPILSTVNPQQTQEIAP